LGKKQIPRPTLKNILDLGEIDHDVFLSEVK